MSKLHRVGLPLFLLVGLFLGTGFPGGTAICQAFEDPFRLGFSGVNDTSGYGVRVVTVNPGSLATKLYKVGGSTTAYPLVSGDLITAIDHVPVRTLRDYYSAMAGVDPAKVVVTVHESTGREADWTTELTNAGVTHHDAKSQPENAAEPAKLYLVVVADTRAAKIGESTNADRLNITSIFHAFIPADRINISTLFADKVTPTNILAMIGRQRSEGLKPNQDTFVFYYSGHGAFNDDAADRVLKTSGGDLRLRDVETAAAKLQPRVTVLLSDACSVVLPTQGASLGYPEPPTRVAPLFESLFFNAKPGVVAISATMRGQEAGCTENGGYFTFWLCDFARSNSDSVACWQTALKTINHDLKSFYPAGRQTACIIGTERQNPRPRFGIDAAATPRSQGRGVEVTLVMPGYPGTAMNLPGDDSPFYLIENRHIITHINAQPVMDKPQFSAAVRNSPDKMIVTVYDPTTDKQHDYETNLSRIGERANEPALPGE